MQTGTPGGGHPPREIARPGASSSESSAPAGGRSYRRERQEGVRAVRGMLIAAGIAGLIWVVIGAAVVAIVIATAR